MKRERQQEILEVISRKRIATQQELAAEVARSGIPATQASISRDIVEIGLTKANGYYTTPQTALPVEGPIGFIDTAGDNLIVVKTEIGQAQPVALAIDGANIAQVVGTLAGDDTIFVAVKNLASQRLAIKKIVKLFSREASAKGLDGKRTARSTSKNR